MIWSFLLLLLCFFLLAIVCDEFFVPALEKIAIRWKLSSEVAGATLMAVGSSAPELFTALFAILNPAIGPSLGAGTIVGSAIFNVLVIVGASVLIRGAITKLQWQPVIRDLVFYSISILLLLWAFSDGLVTMWEMILFVILYIVYVVCTKYRSSWLCYDAPEIIQLDEEIKSAENDKQGLFTRLLQLIEKTLGFVVPANMWGAFVVSIIMIGALTHFMVESGAHFAGAIGMSDALVGLTILAAGTSVPDLISSLIVARKGKVDMAISNAIGSNVFDILFGLGVPYLIYFWFVSTDSTIAIDSENLSASIILLLATVITLLFLLITRKWKLGKRTGLFLIVLYVAYIVYSIVQI